MNDQINEKNLFYSYTSDKEDITFYIMLVQYFPEYKKGRNINLSEYSDNYCSMFDSTKFNSYQTFKKTETLQDIRERIYKYVGFPIEVMGDFGYDGGQKYDEEFGKIFNIVETYNMPINPNTRKIYDYSEIKIKNSIYDSEIIRKRWVYIYIDIDKCKNVKFMNDAILLKDKENNKTQAELKKVSDKNSQLENKIKILDSDRDRLDAENKGLKKFKESIEEEKKKEIEAANSIRAAIVETEENENKKKTIEAKQFVLKNFILNENLFIFLEKFMSKFVNQFFEIFCKKFIEEFKKNSENMINKYDTNSNININHINFIVIGKAGVGKSTLINSILKLKGKDAAKEGIGESVTSETKKYESKIIKMIRMYDTRGVDDKILKQTIYDEVNSIVEKSRKLGPDNYINCILYCTSGDRFQEEDGLLIKKIMKLYPFDNLPVIITQLRYYEPEDAEKMKYEIIKILNKYLEMEIVNKIQIKDVFSKEKITNKIIIPQEEFLNY